MSLFSALILVAFTCSPPTHYTNGNPIDRPLQFNYYYGPAPGNYNNAVIDGPVCTGPETEIVLDVPEGDWYFVVTAICADIPEGGPCMESEFSDPPAFKSVTESPDQPNPPTDLTVIADATAFEVSEGTDSLALLPIGTVPENTPCLTQWPSIGGLYVVPREAVVVANPAIQVPQVVYAACSI